MRMSGPTDTAPATLDIDGEDSCSDLQSAANHAPVGVAPSGAAAEQTGTATLGKWNWIRHSRVVGFGKRFLVAPMGGDVSIFQLARMTLACGSPDSSSTNHCT